MSLELKIPNRDLVFLRKLKALLGEYHASIRAGARENSVSILIEERMYTSIVLSDEIAYCEVQFWGVPCFGGEEE